MMPHHETSSTQRVVPIKAADGVPPPSQDEVASILNTIFATDKSQTSLDASYALTNLLVTTVGHRGFNNYPVLDTIRKAATDKKNAGSREGAMFALGALFERFPLADPLSEVSFLIQDGGIVYLVLDALADKVPATRDSAQYALDALLNNLKPGSLVSGLLPALMRYLSKSTSKWQGNIGALGLIAKISDKSKPGPDGFPESEKEVLRIALGKRLESLIPLVENGMHDLKPEVRFQPTSYYQETNILRLKNKP
jgi:elongation factor 3